MMDLVSIMNDILGYVFTNLSEDELTQALTMIVDNKIFATESLRLPIDGSFFDSGTTGIHNGLRNVTWTLVMGSSKEWKLGEKQLEENIKKLYQFVFLDKEDESADEAQNGQQ